MRKKYLAIFVAVILLWPYLQPLSIRAQQITPARGFDPLAEGVVELSGPAPHPVDPAESQAPGETVNGLPQDWYLQYRTWITSLPLDNPPPDPNNQQGFMAYDVGRYAVPASVYMYRTSQEISFLEDARDQINKMFSPTYFTDGSNGATDGFLGWKFARGDGISYVPGGIPRNTWLHAKIQVTDLNSLQSQVSMTYNGTTFTEVTNNVNPNTHIPFAYPSGTIALLSGWAKTSFRNIVIRNQAGAVIYDLNRHGGTFASDWERIYDPTFPNDTGYWTIQRTREDEADDPVEIEPEVGSPSEAPPMSGSYVISSDATTNTPGPFYYPFDGNSYYNFGRPASGAATGKYSGLVFKRLGLQERNYEIEFDIRLEKRNWAGSEQGVAVRQHEVNGSVSRGERIMPPNPPAPENFPPAGARNPYFRPNGRHIGNLFFPNGIRQVHDENYGFFNGGPTWAAGGGWTDFVPNPKYQERAEYDGGATQGVIQFIEAVYGDRREAFYPDADAFLIKLQNNIIAKWYQKENLSTPDWVYGGITNLDYGGTYKWATDFRFELQFLGFYKLVRDYPERWRSLTLANPSPALPNPDLLAQFYEDHVRSAVRSFLDSTWKHPGTNYYQWWGAGFNRGYWGEFSLWGSDLQHNSYTIYFMSEALKYGLITPDEFAPLARMFTQKIWNGRTSPTEINMGNGQPNPHYRDYAVDIHGLGDARINIGYNTTHLADYYPLLAESDFSVYEIFNTWLQYFAWNQYLTYWSGTGYFYGIHPAMMLYAVKFGRPRNLGVESVPQGNRLFWNHPSDWPGGTTLQYYNIYRRELNQPWPQDPLATVPTSETEYVDDQAAPDQVYLYQVRSQDNTAQFRNESDPSNVIAVKNGALTGGFALHAAPGDGSVLLYWDALREPEPVQYEVMQFDGDKWTTIGITSDQFYTARHLNNGSEYWFRVRRISLADPPSGMDEAIAATPGTIYFIRQPRSRLVCPTWNVEFSVAARGAGPVNLQWQQSVDGGNTWTNINGQEGYTLVVNNVQSNMHNRRYRAAVRTAGGWIYSDAAILTVSNSCPNW